jgi:dTDP-4-dehydrorhamnose reductase
VFDGERTDPYTESCRVSPLNVYGRSKVEAEQHVSAAFPNALIVRTSAFFGPWDSANFVSATVKRIQNAEHVIAASDAVVSPTYVPHLVDLCLDLLLDREKGIWHIANAGCVSWADFARVLSKRVGNHSTIVESIPVESFSLKAPRPRFSALVSERSNFLPSWEKALHDYWCEMAY